MSVSQDGSESVDQFLARIASVRENRDVVSEERTRRKEEDFLKNRKERQAKRLERARSLSPSKTGPSASSGFAQQSPASNRDTVLNPPVDFSPRSSTLSRSNAISARTSPKLEPKRIEVEPSSPSPNTDATSASASGLARSGTLSWQQRPPRDSSTLRPRPLSTYETTRPIQTLEDEQPQSNPQLTRQEIAASLGLKDPTWFRQTQERGIGSAAFRKNQVEDTTTVEHMTRSHGLVGMSNEISRSASTTPARDFESPASTRGTGLYPSPKERAGRAPSPTPVKLSNTPGLEPSARETSPALSHPAIVSNDLARHDSIRGGRPPSPTKGLGGFVESAMMKRSDSVNKRWSVQANTGLKRGDSIAGVKPLSGVRSMQISSLSRGTNRDVSSSPIPTSQPESRGGSPGPKSRPATPDGPKDIGVSPEVVSPAVNIPGMRSQSPTEGLLSRSPSKTLDPKRWSPTKSSWLESALLAKPDTTKPQPAKEEIPAWKATLQRNKASRDLSPDKNQLVDAKSSGILASSETRPHQLSALSKKPDVASKPIGYASEVAQSEIATVKSKQEEPTSEPAMVEGSEASSVEESLAAPVESQSESLKHAAGEAKSEALPSDKLDKKMPPVLKPKPQTTPKTDFRSTLRSRAPVNTGGREAEPEFKSIFGKLKPAQTQNYVAPDTLKDNILSGKASLAVTGGPQKAQRIDEFKESILQKKEAMKTSAMQQKDKPPVETNPQAPVIPEALARRKTLYKSSPSIAKPQVVSGPPQSNVQEKPKPTFTPRPKPSNVQPDYASPETSKKLSSPTENVRAEDKATHAKPEVKELLPPRQPPRSVQPPLQDRTAGPLKSQSKPPSSSAPVSVEPIASKAELPAGSKLASRLNPNLAALISRSGSPHLATSKPSSPEKLDDVMAKPIATRSSEQESSTGSDLTHMTKGRARGPKRRAPKSQAAAESPSTDVKVESNDSDLITQDNNSKPRALAKKSFTTSGESPQTLGKISAATTTTASTVPAVSIETEPLNKVSSAPEGRSKAKPAVASKSPQLRRVSSRVTHEQGDDLVSYSPSNAHFNIATDSSNTAPEELPRPLKDFSIVPKPAMVPLPLTPNKSRANAPKIAQSPASPPAKPQAFKPATGLGVSVPPLNSKPAITSNQPTLSSGHPQKPSSDIKAQSRSGSDDNLVPILSAYFTKPLDREQRADFDAEELLVRAQEPPQKVKSLSHAIWEIVGDGKKVAMPSQQEHILFEESLYLVTHTFESSSGTRSSEVYLWRGDDTADAAVEDAQFFCRKDAKEHNAKLEMVRQGKEPPSFFQALGGVLIIRRAKTSSSYMLRGRRHLGHISFDEVEFSASNLCSGFSYLIQAASGKLYLWKGNGSAADEVGCARLIGMDLGEIDEIVDGQEPPSFWNAFPQRTRNETKWSEDWQRRATHNSYPTSLYRVELDRPKSAGSFWGLRAVSPPKASNRVAVEVISPFCGRDVDPSNIYILDAYRSIYVILDPLATSKSSEIVTAFYLAQDMAMLSPSIQDRSLIPSCFVIFGEPPADVKISFRKWDERNTARLGGGTDRDRLSTCARLEDVLEALKL